MSCTSIPQGRFMKRLRKKKSLKSVKNEKEKKIKEQSGKVNDSFSKSGCCLAPRAQPKKEKKKWSKFCISGVENQIECLWLKSFSFLENLILKKEKKRKKCVCGGDNQ